MSETIILDAAALSPAPAVRTQLDITQWIAAAGPNWGDSDIQAYMSDMAVGSSPVDYRIPNRMISIPLVLRTLGGVTFQTINTQLQQKIAVLQREGGWILRTVGGTNLYADVVNATLHLGGAWLQAYRDADVDAVLSLECIPDWYGDEVTLDTLSGTTAVTSVALQAAGTAVIAGDHPGRVRFVASDTSANDQHGLLWGVRARNYSGSATAALSYEAETMTALNGAGTTALTGASNGSAVTHGSLTHGIWSAVLYTNLTAGAAPLTHVGNYRVWARCYSTSAVPQFQLQWGVGALSAPTTNDAARLPGTAAFYMLDLGPVSLTPPPVGPADWFGAIQAKVDSDNDPIAIDRIFFQPVDESAGKLQALSPTAAPPVSSLDTFAVTPTVGADDSAVGSVAWTSTGNIFARDSLYASVSISGGATSHYLKATGYGFAIPSAATIRGIAVVMYWTWSFTGSAGFANQFRLVKAGTVQTGAASSSTTGVLGADKWVQVGGPTDLWAAAWTPTDINNAGFGAAFAAVSTHGTFTMNVNVITVEVWYTLPGSLTLTVAQDAVIYASKTAELRTDGMFRSDAGGTIYAPVSQVTGDLPRIPPSGLENRPVQIFLKPTRGDFDQLPDGGLDGLSVIPKVRPSYLFRP